MYFSIAAATILAADICIRKTLRVLESLDSMYLKLRLQVDLQHVLKPLHFGYKIGLAKALIGEYEQQTMQGKDPPPATETDAGGPNDDVTVRYVLTEMHDTANRVIDEMTRLQKLSNATAPSRWKPWTWGRQPDWKVEIVTLGLHDTNLSRQIGDLMLLLQIYYLKCNVHG